MSSTSITITYGPYQSILLQHDLLFMTATKLLQQGTPRLQFRASLPPSSESQEEGVTRIPVVRLPEDILSRLYQNSNRNAEGTTSPSEVSQLGRPALEVNTDTLGQLAITTWQQWEAAKNLLVEEFQVKKRAGGGDSEMGAELEIQLEVIILWMEQDTLHKLYYEDVCDDDEEEEKELAPLDDDQNNISDHPEVEENNKDLLSGRGSRNGFTPTPHKTPREKTDEINEGENRVAIVMHPSELDQPPATSPSSAVVVVPHYSDHSRRDAYARPAHRATHLSINLRIIDPQGTAHGSCIIPLFHSSSSPSMDGRGSDELTLQELIELVKSASGIRRHRSVRIAYCVLPSGSVTTGNGGASRPLPSPSRLGAAALLSGDHPHCHSAPPPLGTDTTEGRLHPVPPGSSGSNGAGASILSHCPLHTIDNEADIQDLMQHIIIHGSRSIRLVVTESSAPPPTWRNGNHEKNITVDYGGERVAFRLTDAQSVAASSRAVPMQRNDLPIHYHQNNNSNPQEERYFDDVFFSNHSRRPLPPSPLPPSNPVPRRVMPATSAEEEEAPTVSIHSTPRGRVSPPVDPYSQETSRHSPQSSTSNNYNNNINNNNNNNEGTVVVRYEVDPTALFISGPVSPSALGYLSKRLSALCARHNARPHSSSLRRHFSVPEFKLIFPSSEEELGGGGNSKGNHHHHSGSSNSPLYYYKLDLQEYHFSEAEEEELEVYVAEAMNVFEGLERKMNTQKDNIDLYNISEIS